MCIPKLVFPLVNNNVISHIESAFFTPAMLSKARWFPGRDSPYTKVQRIMNFVNVSVSLCICSAQVGIGDLKGKQSERKCRKIPMLLYTNGQLNVPPLILTCLSAFL